MRRASVQTVGTEDMAVMACLSISAPRPVMMSARKGGRMKRSPPLSQGKSALQIRPWPKCVGRRQRVRA